MQLFIKPMSLQCSSRRIILENIPSVDYTRKDRT